MLFHTLQLLLGWDSWISYGFFRPTILEVLNAGGRKYISVQKKHPLVEWGWVVQLHAFSLHVCIQRCWKMSHCRHCVCCFVPVGEVVSRCDLHPAIKMQHVLFIASYAPLCTTFHFD